MTKPLSEDFTTDEEVVLVMEVPKIFKVIPAGTEISFPSGTTMKIHQESFIVDAAWLHKQRQNKVVVTLK